jgi:hypothetical protein
MKSFIDSNKQHDTNYLPLYQALRLHLTGNAAKLKLFAQLTLGILIFSTVNLAQIALIADTEVKQKSLYRRLQRFFSNFNFPRIQFSSLLLKLLPEKTPLILAMDRTNWKFGRHHINILQIGIIFDGILYPLIWKTLPQETKRGNSDTAQRMTLMEELLQVIPDQKISCLLMDREFIGNDWLGWLHGKNIPFIVRLRSNSLLDQEAVMALVASGIWRQTPGKTSQGQGCPVYFFAKELENDADKYLLLIGNRHEGEELANLYQKRWGIECFFSHLKTRGFNFEDTHLTDPERIDKMLGALALAFIFSHRQGLEENAKKKRQ